MRWVRRLINVFRSERLSRDLDRELAFHVAERADALRAAGLDAESAEREARRRLGNYAAQKERTRDMDILVWLDTIRADVRYAWRVLVASPGFALVAIGSLALGIGANTAIFSLLDAAVLKPLPVHAPEELVQVKPGEMAIAFPNPLWEQLRDRQTIFSGIAAYSGVEFNLAQGGVARRVHGSLVSGDFFSMLGVGPAVGRVLALSDDVRGCPAVAVLGSSFWRSEYGASPDVVGRTLMLDGKPFEVVGVAERSFRGVSIGRDVQAYIPLCAEAVIAGERSGLDQRSRWFLEVLGRPLPGTPIEAVNAHLAAVAPASFGATVPDHYPAEARAEYEQGAFVAEPAAAGFSEIRMQYSSALMVLMGLVGVVLLVACANVANLMLARAAARQHEIDVRLAIGAGRRRIVRQLLTESLLIALLSSVLGVFIAVQGSRLLVSMLSTGARSVTLDLPLDARMLLFTLLAATSAAVLFGMAPAWRASRSNPQNALRGGRGVITGHTRFRAGKVLVVAQIALSLALVVCAGLLLGTFQRLSNDPMGFDRTGVMLVHVDLPDDEETFERQRTVVAGMLGGLRALRHVEAAAMSQLTPVGRAAWNDLIFVDGHAGSTDQDALSFMNEVSDDYFATLGTRIIAGREFDERDTRGALRVAVVNEEFARHYYGAVNVVGREFRLRSADGAPVQIIGVVETAKYRAVREEPERVGYLAWSQAEERAFGMTFAVRSRASAGELVPEITRIAAAADPTASLRITALSQQVSDSLARERVLAVLSAAFGSLALGLAMIGLYGVMSCNVARRRNEIGIRMALGSARGHVLRMVLGEASWMIAGGLLLGAGMAWAGTRLVRSFLWGVSPGDPATLVFSAALLGLAGLAASALPAWRAARVDPMSALRED